MRSTKSTSGRLGSISGSSKSNAHSPAAAASRSSVPKPPAAPPAAAQLLAAARLPSSRPDSPPPGSACVATPMLLWLRRLGWPPVSLPPRRRLRLWTSDGGPFGVDALLQGSGVLPPAGLPASGDDAVRCSGAAGGRGGMGLHEEAASAVLHAAPSTKPLHTSAGPAGRPQLAPLVCVGRPSPVFDKPPLAPPLALGLASGCAVSVGQEAKLPRLPLPLPRACAAISDPPSQVLANEGHVTSAGTGLPWLLAASRLARRPCCWPLGWPDAPPACCCLGVLQS